MDEDEERRERYRYKRHDKLFMQVLTCNEKHEIDRVTVFCHSCDESNHGLKVEAEMQLEIDSLVDLWVAFEGLERKFYLQGHVCWCYKPENGENLYQIGIGLSEAKSTDYADWSELINSFSE